MKKRYFYFVFILLTIAGCKKQGTTTPQRKDITQAVYASGKIYPLYDYRVFSKLPGYIEKIHVHIGDIVKIGQALVTIKSEISDLNVSTAKNLLELARKNAAENSPQLSALKQDVASAKSKYELDSLAFVRFSNLLNQNATAKASYDQAKTQFEISKQNFFKTRNNYQVMKDRVQVELENAGIQYNAQLSNKNDNTITSAINGKIYDIIPKEGELISSQIMIMEIGGNKQYEVELSVDETDVSFLRKGQQILFAIDAYKDKMFKGKIEEVYPRINQANKTSKVIASLESDSTFAIYSGMSVEANIIISERKNALVIPREYLIEGKKVKLKSSNELVIIQKGAEDLEYVEILSGIDEKTEIKKP